jgi:hypothetical protein
MSQPFSISAHGSVVQFPSPGRCEHSGRVYQLSGMRLFDVTSVTYSAATTSQWLSDALIFNSQKSYRTAVSRVNEFPWAGGPPVGMKARVSKAH